MNNILLEKHKKMYENPDFEKIIIEKFQLVLTKLETTVLG